jgi:hypothetical protein
MSLGTASQAQMDDYSSTSARQARAARRDATTDAAAGAGASAQTETSAGDAEEPGDGNPDDDEVERERGDPQEQRRRREAWLREQRQWELGSSPQPSERKSEGVEAADARRPEAAAVPADAVSEKLPIPPEADVRASVGPRPMSGESDHVRRASRYFLSKAELGEILTTDEIRKYARRNRLQIAPEIVRGLRQRFIALAVRRNYRRPDLYQTISIPKLSILQVSVSQSHAPACAGWATPLTLSHHLSLSLSRARADA